MNIAEPPDCPESPRGHIFLHINEHVYFDSDEVLTTEYAMKDLRPGIWSCSKCGQQVQVKGGEAAT